MNIDQLRLPDLPGIEGAADDLKRFWALLNRVSTEGIEELVTGVESNPHCSTSDRNLVRMAAAMIFFQRPGADGSTLDRIIERLERDQAGRPILDVDLS